MNILVIGGSRFIGRRLVSHLLESQHNVVVMNRGSQPLPENPRLEFVKGDRNDPGQLSSIVHSRVWDVIYDQVCFTASQARMSGELFKGFTKRLVFLSTQAVYPVASLAMPETHFDPYSYRFSEDAHQGFYAEAKRQCEAVYHQMLPNETLSVRLPIVVGTDDYLGRLHWHIRSIANGTCIYFPNLKARISLIRSEDAARTLHHLADRGDVGPINSSAPDSMPIQNIISLIENRCKRRVVLAAVRGEGDFSKFDWWGPCSMSIRKLEESGLKIPEMENWLGPLIDECYQKALEGH